MSRQSFLIPRKGTASQISNLTADAASQVDNEFFIDQSTKELYVGTGAGSYNGVKARPVTFNVNKLISAGGLVSGDEIAVYKGGETRKTTLGDIVSLVSATAGDNKDIKVVTTDTTPGFLNDKITVGSGITKSVVNGTADAKLQLQFDSSYKVPTSGTADNALTLGGKSIGTGSDNVWTGATIQNWMQGATVIGAKFFGHPTGTSNNAFLTKTESQINSMISLAGGDQVVAEGDIFVQAYFTSNTTDAISVRVFTVDTIIGGTITWSGPVVASTNQRYVTDFYVNSAGDAMTQEDHLLFIDNIKISTVNYSRARKFAVEVYTAGGGIDISSGTISTKVNANSLEVHSTDREMYVKLQGQSANDKTSTRNGLSRDGGLAVKLKAASGLKFTSHEIDIDYDDITIGLDSNNKLSIKEVNGGTI